MNKNARVAIYILNLYISARSLVHLGSIWLKHFIACKEQGDSNQVIVSCISRSQFLRERS